MSVSSTAPTTTRRRTTSRRPAAVAALVVLAALLIGTVGTVGTAGTAEAATTTDRSDAAAGWLGRQLSADHVVMGAFGPDYGLTADVVLALDSAQVGRKAAHRATRALEKHVDEYTGFGDPNEFYAGSFAKLLNVAVAAHANPHAFGHGARSADIVGILRYLECGNSQRPACAPGDDGRFADISQFGDFSNTIGQSLAVVGLERATKAGASAASVAYLRKQQCANGAFPLEMSTAGCTASVDGTAFAVHALLDYGTRKATAAASDAAGWLKRHQHGNGSFTGNGVRNTNSTGLAAQALRAAGRDKAAAKAVRFVASLQIGCSGKEQHRGKVRYDKQNTGDAVRATAQAVPAMAGVGLADISRSDKRRALPTLRCS